MAIGTADTASWVRWRGDLLEQVGFPRDLAARTAADDRMDVHALIGLVDRGCPPELAVRIVAPLDGPAE